MLQDNQDILKTSADELFDLVKKRQKISVEEAAKLLRLPQMTVQSLVDFLVEEKIFGLEYKFTTPFIYLGKEELGKKAVSKKASFIAKLATKEGFYERSKSRNIPHEKIESLWRKYLNQNLHNIKDEFYQKAKSKNVSKEKIDALWKKYISYLT